MAVAVLMAELVVAPDSRAVVAKAVAETVLAVTDL